MTNDEDAAASDAAGTAASSVATWPSRPDLRHSSFVIPSSLVIRHSSFATLCVAIIILLGAGPLLAQFEILPPGAARPNAGDFPALPPDPYAAENAPLPPLDEELWNHGGSYLYEAEGDRLNWPSDEHAHYDLLRLPEEWQEPRPATLFADFLGADPVTVNPHLKWPGPGGYVWEPRFVGYGSYQLFGFALQQDNRRQDVLGHQLLVDLDLALTGTERFHVQFRPLGRRNTGGSYYQFSDPEGYIDNSTAEPDRYWFEGELHSMLGGFVDPFAALDYTIVAGRFPFALHNFLLLNSDILGVAVNKNTIYCGTLSNLNVQVFHAKNDVNSFVNSDAWLSGVHVSADHRRAFYELSYVFVEHDFDATRDAHFAAVSRTKFYGPLSVAGRALLKWGDKGGRGSGQLFVVETNYTREFDDNWPGIQRGVFFCNAFGATSGWNSIGGGNFNRLRTTFEVNPLVRIAARQQTSDTWGAALGVQLFRRNADESFIPEIAFQSPGGDPVWGAGLRYLRKTGPRSFFEALGVINFSDNPQFDRDGVFVSQTILF